MTQLNNNIIIKELQLNENDNNKDDIIITHDNSYIDELYSIQTTENSNINIGITDGKIPFTDLITPSSESVILKDTKININFNNAINGDYGIEKDGIKLGSDITINKVNSGIYDHNKQFEYENHTYKIHEDYNDVVLEDASSYVRPFSGTTDVKIGEKLILNPLGLLNGDYIFKFTSDDENFSVISKPINFTSTNSISTFNMSTITNTSLFITIDDEIITFPSGSSMTDIKSILDAFKNCTLLIDGTFTTRRNIQSIYR